jgi:chromosome segregation ATPase
MASDTELKATIARRESEIAERLATIAMLREKLATTEADLAGLAAMREKRIDDVPTAELGDYLTRLRTLESDAAALRKVKKEIERRLSAENNAQSALCLLRSLTRSRCWRRWHP